MRRNDKLVIALAINSATYVFTCKDTREAADRGLIIPKPAGLKCDMPAKSASKAKRTERRLLRNALKDQLRSHLAWAPMTTLFKPSLEQAEKSLDMATHGIGDREEIEEHYASGLATLKKVDHYHLHLLKNGQTTLTTALPMGR